MDDGVGSVPDVPRDAGPMHEFPVVLPVHQGSGFGLLGLVDDRYVRHVHVHKSGTQTGKNDIY